MRNLGLDYGAKRIGVAISDESGGFAFPKETIPNDEITLEYIEKLIEKGLLVIFPAAKVQF